MILLIKLCLCILFVISRVYLGESNTECRHDDTYCWSEVIHDIHNGVQYSCRTIHRQLLFRRHVNDDSKYYGQTKIEQKKDKKFSRLRITLLRVFTIIVACKLKGGGLRRWVETNLDPHKREICCNLDDFSKKKIPLFHRKLEN